MCSLSVLAQDKPDTLELINPKNIIYPKEQHLIDKDDEARETVDRISARANSKGFSRFLSRVFFRVKKKPKTKSDTEEEPEIIGFRGYNDKIIRNIDVVSLKPYENSAEYNDIFFRVKRKNTGGWARMNNSIHVATSDRVLKNQLMFKPNDVLRAKALEENLAFLRNRSYIYDAQFIIDSISPDSVDIKLVTRDVVAYDVRVGRLDDRKGEIGIGNKNFLGTGTSIRASLLYATKHSPPLGYKLSYSTGNILGTFFQSGIYLQNIYNRKQRHFYFSRNFHQNLSNIVGVEYTYDDIPRYFRTLDSFRNIKTEKYAFWAGKSFKVTDDKDRRIVAQASFTHRRLLSHDLPNMEHQIYQPYERSQMFLVGLSFFKQYFQTDRFIYSYGTRESTPIGYNLSLQLGYENHKYFNRFYVSGSYSYGKQLRHGYHFHKIEMGTFLNKGQPEQGMFKVSVNYFSNLLDFGKVRIRQFINIDYTAGIKRLQGEGDFLYFTDDTRLKLYSFRAVGSGAQRLRFSSETAIFTNASLLGSRLVCFGFAEGSFVGSENALFKNKFLSGFGIGLRLGNEFCAFRSIELKIGYYPRIPQNRFSHFFRSSSVEKFLRHDFRPNPPEVIEFR